MNLTPRQLTILTRIRDMRLTRGYSPTMQELADELGVSKVTVFEHVEALIKKGALQREANRARSLQLTPNVQLPDEQGHTRLPLVGKIAAGSPIEAVEDREHLDLESLFAPPPGKKARELFALQVRGDSMIEDQICDGDYVICQQAETARNGQTVVALLLDSNEATLKKFYRERNGRIRLQPANPAFEPIWLDPDRVQIQGILMGVVRAF